MTRGGRGGGDDGRTMTGGAEGVGHEHRRLQDDEDDENEERAGEAAELRQGEV